MSGSLWPHGLPHTKLPCPSLSSRVCLNSCRSSQWCHPTISSSIVPFSHCLLYFPASGSFPLCWLFASESQSIGSFFNFSNSPSNEYSGLIYFGIDWFDLLAVQRTLKSLWNSQQFKSFNSLALSLLYGPDKTSIYDYWKTIALIIQTFVGKVMFLLFDVLSRFVIVFLSSSKHL